MSALFAGVVLVAPDGSMTVSRRSFGDVGYDVFGGSETTKVLALDSGSGAWAVLDVDNGAATTVTSSIPAVDPVNSLVDPVVATMGAGFLIFDVVYSTDTWDASYSLQRMALRPDDTLIEDGPRMTIPETAVVGVNPHDFWQTYPAQVWDEPPWTFVGLVRWVDATHTVVIELAIWDNVLAAPSIVTLYTSDDGTPWYPNNNCVRVTQSGGVYSVIYERQPMVSVVPSDRTWSSYARRTLDPATGTLGPEVFVSDTYDNPETPDMVRADDGISAQQIANYMPTHSGLSSEKLVLIVADGSTDPGDSLFLDWQGTDAVPSGYADLFAAASVLLDSGAGAGGTNPGSNTFVPANFGAGLFESRAQLSLRVTAPNQWVETLKAISAPAVVQPYYVVRGFARAHTPMGIVATPTVDTGALTPGGGWPDPATVDLGADLRWLPTALGTTWDTTVGSASLALSAATLDLSRGYMRGSDWASGGAVLLDDDGTGLQLVGADFTGITVALVAVVDVPNAPYATLVSTAASDGWSHPETPYLDLRYQQDGKVVLESLARLSAFQSTTGTARPGQPVIVLLSLDATDGWVISALCDRNAMVRFDRLGGTDHPTAGDLWIGYNPAEPDSQADMQILDLAVWNRALAYDEVAGVLHTLDGIYGVTVS